MQQAPSQNDDPAAIEKLISALMFYYRSKSGNVLLLFTTVRFRPALNADPVEKNFIREGGAVIVSNNCRRSAFERAARYATMGAANAGAATSAAAPLNRGCSSTATVRMSVRAVRSVKARSLRAALTDASIKSQAAVISPPM
jgi:hypothetical protein